MIIPFDYDVIMYYFPKSNNYLVLVYDEEDEEYTLINSNSKDVCLSSFSNVVLCYNSMVYSNFVNEAAAAEEEEEEDFNVFTCLFNF